MERCYAWGSSPELIVPSSVCHPGGVHHMIKRTLVQAAVVGLALTSAVQAQTPAATTPPPKVIQIYREILKPGHGAAHAKTEAGWPAAFRKVDWPSHYLAATSTSGPNEAWFISAWDSYAAYETDTRNVEANAPLLAEMDRLGTADGEHLQSSSSLFASLRDDLSYLAGVNVPSMRYFQVTR